MSSHAPSGAMGQPDDRAASRIGDLLIECLDRFQRDGEAGIEAFLAEHPEDAALLRQRIQFLRNAGFLADVPAAEVVSPKQLGEFHIVARLGSGGMGVVYRAQQSALGREVALKLIRPDQVDLPGAKDRFVREIEAAARLQHPGIVPVYTVGEDHGIPFYAMELVPGCTLMDVLQRLQGRSPESLLGADLASAVTALAFPASDPESPASVSPIFAGGWPEACVRLVRQVADALNHAHARGVLHRDIKPSNLMLTRAGRVMLFDFGLAAAAGTHRLTQTGTQLGSLHYMPPEQLRGEVLKIDRRADIYALGVTLYELLALRPPYEAGSAETTRRLVLEGMPPALRTRNRAVSWEVETVCGKAMERDAARRYATAGDFARDLDNILERRPIEARRASWSLRARRWIQRKPALGTGVAAAALAALSLVGFGAWWLMQPGHLTVASPTEGVTVYIDGEWRGTTPLELELSPGRHRLRLEKGEDLLPLEESVSIRQTERRQIERTLPSRSGLIRFESDPPGAKITLLASSGAVLSVPEPSPTLFQALAGSYRARFELEGFEAREASLEVHPGGALVPCHMGWETGELVFDGFQIGTQIEVYAGERVPAGPPIRTIGLATGPVRMQVPAGVYSIHAHLKEHDRQELAGERAVRVEAGREAHIGIALPPLERLVEYSAREAVNTLLVADLDDDGVAEIAAATRSSRVLLLNGDGLLRRELRMSGAIATLVAADLDGDGRSEVVAGSCGGESPWLFECRPDGSVRPFEKSRFEGAVGRVWPVDLDGDEISELVVATAVPDDIRVLFFAADGSALPRAEPSPDEKLAAVETADLDGDGRAESIGCTTSGRIVVIRPDRAPHAWTAAGQHLPPILAADLDGDGRPEILAGTPEGRLVALRSDGSTFAAWQPPLIDEAPANVRGASKHPGSTPAFGAKLLVADLDGDGRDEVVVAKLSGRIEVLASNGLLRFTALASGIVDALVAADMDGVGKRVIACGTKEGRILGLDTDGRRRFEAQVLGTVSRLGAGDLDGDGREELVASTTKGGIFAFGIPRARPRWERADEESFRQGVMADLDLDGRNEFIGGMVSGRIVVISPDGATNFERRLVGCIHSVLAVDLDRSGPPEIVAGTTAGHVVAFASDGSSRFEVDLGSEVGAMATADLEGNGSVAVLVGTADGRIVALSRAGERLLEIPFGRPVGALLGTDLDGDGRREIVAGPSRTELTDAGWVGDVVAFRANAERIWAAPVSGAVQVLAAAELDGVEPREIVGANFNGTFRAFALRADGTEQLRIHVSEGPIVSFLAADLDGDDKSEIVTGTRGGDIEGWNADGSRRFAAKLSAGVFNLAHADLDGDGRREILAAGQTGEILALDHRGSRFAKIEWRASAYGLLVQEPRIGEPETLVGAGRLIAVFPGPAPDPRRRLRATFLDALSAAERGDEDAASRDFSEARFRWLPFDDADLGSIMERLVACAASPSAQRMSATLERIHVFTPREWIERIEHLLLDDQIAAALDLANRHLASPAHHPALGELLNALAWKLVNPARAVVGAEALALVVARASADASGRQDPACLHTLAEALHANGQSTEAVATMDEALRLVPSEHPLRERYVGYAERFRIAAAQQVAGPAAEAPPARR